VLLRRRTENTHTLRPCGALTSCSRCGTVAPLRLLVSDQCIPESVAGTVVGQLGEAPVVKRIKGSGTSRLLDSDAQPKHRSAPATVLCGNGDVDAGLSRTSVALRAVAAGEHDHNFRVPRDKGNAFAARGPAPAEGERVRLRLRVEPSQLERVLHDARGGLCHVRGVLVAGHGDGREVRHRAFV